jgi:ribosomal protein S18 acetylase RimI-like enzyme
VFASGLRDFRDFNTARVEGADPGIGADVIAAAADQVQAELAHRRVEVEDEGAGERVRAGFERLGWRTERLVWLLRAGRAPRADEAVAIEEVAFEATRDLRRRWARESARDQAGFDGFALVEEVVAVRRDLRALAVLEGGEPVAFAAWWAAGGTAEIDQVYCDPGRRGRGLGSALVLRAIADAGAGTAVIVADDDAGDARRLYERLGFEAAWIQHVFTRLPS